jgi:putative Mg2+ transporter-C (MgtC) family protein
VSLSVEIVLRLLLATVLGAGIGFQREWSGKPAGIRTHSLICLGSALFVIVSMYGFEGAFDPSRVAAGMVAGVGFLGAGMIFHGNKGD